MNKNINALDDMLDTFKVNCESVIQTYENDDSVKELVEEIMIQTYYALDSIADAIKKLQETNK